MHALFVHQSNIILNCIFLYNNKKTRENTVFNIADLIPIPFHTFFHLEHQRNNFQNRNFSILRLEAW